MKRVLTGLVLFAIGSYVITQGHIALMLFLWLIGVLAFYEVQLTELKSRLLMVTNMVFYTLLLGFLYQRRFGVWMALFGTNSDVFGAFYV